MSYTEKGPFQEAETPVNDVAGAIQIEGTQPEKPLSRLSRVLTEEDLKGAGVRKMLLGQLDEYEQCKSELSEYRTNYHSKDKEAAVLSEKLNSFVTFEWLYSLLLTVGAILIGYYASQPKQGVVLLVLGIISVIAAVYIKYKHSHENKV